MNTTIIPIQLGIANVYLLKSDTAAVLVDTGVTGTLDKLQAVLQEQGLSFRNIKLIIITHGHADHIGQAAELAERTGAPVLMQQSDARWLIEGKGAPASPVTLGARIMIGLLGVIESRFKVLPYTPRQLPDGEEMSLGEFGINGRVLHTPGHTPGSLSVVLDDGSAIVGDMAMNSIPIMRPGAGLPSIAVDAEQVKETWRRLLDAGVKQVYPGHGKPFSADIIAKEVK